MSKTMSRMSTEEWEQRVRRAWQVFGTEKPPTSVQFRGHRIDGMDPDVGLLQRGEVYAFSVLGDNGFGVVRELIVVDPMTTVTPARVYIGEHLEGINLPLDGNALTFAQLHDNYYWLRQDYTTIGAGHHHKQKFELTLCGRGTHALRHRGLQDYLEMCRREVEEAIEKFHQGLSTELVDFGTWINPKLEVD